MARKHLSHIKSKLTENGGPKLPTPSQLIEGEIAVNFAKGYETLSILNSNSGITTFSNDTTIMSYVDGQDMEIANAAGISAVTTSQGLTDYQYVATPNNPILSGATSLKNADELLSQTILDNEIVIARALNDINDRKLDASAYTPTDLSNYYNKQEIDTALSGKQDTLISGTNIKTVNNTTLLGSGNIDADDVVMGKLDGTAFYKVTGYTGLNSEPQFSSTPETGNQEKIYVDILTDKAYRWRKEGHFVTGENRYELLGEELSIITDGEINSFMPASYKRAVSAKVLRDNFYTETEVDNALSRKQDTLSAGTGIDITNNVVSCTLEMTEFVSELPLTGETGKIYFVPNAESEEQGNVFTEYAWTTGNTWEKIGEWKADMTIDQELDSGSTNPVANSAITEALNSMAQEFVIECSGDTLTDSQEGASSLTITNGVTAQDVVDAYNQGKNIVVDAYFVLQNIAPLSLVANIDSILASGNDFMGMGEATVTLREMVWSSPVDSVRFAVTTEQSQLDVVAFMVLSPLISYDTTENEASLIMLSEGTDGLAGNFSPKFRYSTDLDSNLSPVVAYLDDLDEMIDDVKVDQEYFTTNGASTFATPNKRYNVVDVLELEDGVTYNVGSGCTIHFWNDGALSGNSSDSSTLVLDGTLITGPMHKLFGDNVTFGGPMRNSECYPEWFGAIGDGVADDAAAINRCIYNAGYTPVVLNAMHYFVGSTIFVTESGFNTLLNTSIGYTTYTSWGRSQQFIARHNIIGSASLNGPVLCVEANATICRVYGYIAVRNSGDSAVGFSTLKVSGADSGNQNQNIYIHGILKGEYGDWYASQGGSTSDSYYATYGIGHGTGAVLAGLGCDVTIDVIMGFEKGVHLARFWSSSLHVGQCESIYSVYMGTPYQCTDSYFCTRNKIFIGTAVATLQNYCKYIVNAPHSAIIREDGTQEIAMNNITIGETNSGSNRRHPHKHSLYYTGGSAHGHTGNIYNFNITYGGESKRDIIKCEYASAPTEPGKGTMNGDIINFGVSCYLRDIDIPYGWNVKLNNVIVQNTNPSNGSYRWGGSSVELLMDTVTISKESTPIWSSASSTIKLLRINPQHNGKVIATDTIPSTCENGKLYVVDNPQVTITTNDTKKYPVYANYFGSGATLVGYSLDNYKEPQSLIAGDGIEISSANVISATISVDSDLDSGSTNPVANSAITFELSEIEEAVGASLWDLNAKIVDNRHDIEMLIDDVLVNAEVLAASGTSTFAQANKRYNIDGELELESGATYNVGSGSTIHFFNSGKLTGEAILAVNNTNIDAPMKQIFDENIELGGLLRNSEIYPEWWGAAGDGVADDADAINRCIKMACHTPVVLTAENYLVKSTIGFEEDVVNEAANRAAGITNWAATANTANQLIIKHNIIGDENLAGPVVRFAVAYGICKIYGCIVVRCASDDAIGFTMFPTPGKSFGGNTGEIYIKAIRKGATANFYYGYSQASYISTYGIGNSVGAVLMATSCKVTIDHVCGFKHGVYLSRVMDSVIHIGECESVYCLYLGSPKSSWITKDGHFFVTRNKIFVGKPSIQNTGYQVDYITGVTDSSLVKEDGNEEISLNEITIGDNNAGANSRHPYRHSLLYTAGSGGHTGNKYNFNMTYAVESTTSPARKFVKFVYASNPGASNVGQACGDIINFGVGCYLKDIDIPYGWNVKLNNVLISNESKSTGTYRWFGGFLLLDTVTVSRITSPFHSSASTINILSVNPQCKGMIVTTDTTPSTCENGKLYVVETPVTSGGTAKYPAYCNYFGSGATLVGYVLDNYKDGGGESYVEATYSDLKTLRDNGELVPGTWYRITDYQCTTTQTDTSAATNQFDILVLATDVDKLSEEARAVNHDGDTYFSGSTLGAWKVWYCLDNDKNRFAWADDSVDEDVDSFITISNNPGIIYYYKNFVGDKHLWKSSEGTGVYTDSETPGNGDTVYDYQKRTGYKRVGEVTSYTPAQEGTGLPNGRGVIYRLIDEWNNDCPYDFKNIMFKRPLTNGAYYTGGTDTWCYTFNAWYQSSCADASIVGNIIVGGDDFVFGVYDNKFGHLVSTDVGTTLIFKLPDNVFATTVIDNVEYDGCHSNTFGDDCEKNTFGNNCFDNVFGYGCNENVLGNHCYHNRLEDSCYRNILGDYSFDNVLGAGCRQNTFDGYDSSNILGAGCRQNTFDTECGNNTLYNDCRLNAFGPECNRNRIGHGCSSNSFTYQCNGNILENNCTSNEFGDMCDYNTLCSSCVSNTFGDSCMYNSLGNGCSTNTFEVGFVNCRLGNNVNHITFSKNYGSSIIIENGNQYITITSTQTPTSGNNLRNITIAQGVNNTSTTKTISHNTLNDTFHTTYQPANSQVISV